MAFKSKPGDSNKILFWLLLIILSGAFLRFYHLGFPSLGNDELETLRMSDYNSISSMINEGIVPDVHPPGFQLLIYIIMKNFGDSEFILRLPSAIAGILSIYVIFLLGKLIFSIREGLYSAVFLAISWCPLYYSQEARSYSLLLLF